MKNKVIFSIIGIFLLVGLIGAGFYYFSGEKLSQQIVGSSALGLQEVDYFKSSSECFDSSSDKLWMYTLRGGGLGQWAEGGVDSDDVDDYYDGKERPENKLKIDTKFDQWCVYPISKDNSATPIYKLSDPIEWACTGFNIDKKANEKCGDAELYYYGKYSWSVTCWCSKRITKTGAIASSQNFNNPSTKTEMEIEVEAKGDKYSETFVSNEKIRGKIGNNVCAVWQGNTVTGDECGLPSKDARPAYISGKWKLLADNYYYDYRVKWNDVLLTLQSGSGSKSFIGDSIDGLNSKADRTLNSQINFGTINQPTSLVNAKVEKKLDSFIQYPILTLYIKANWLGVVTPIPDPKIKDISSSCFGSGRQGTIKVEVKNEGNERGEVDIYRKSGTCPNFDVSRKSISFDAGETKTIYLDIESTTDTEEFKETCTIVADAIENIDEEDVEVCVTGHATCTKGEEWCEDKNRWWCPDPIKPEMKEDCVAQSQVCNYASDGTTFCADSPDWCEDHPEDPKCIGNGECGYWTIIPGFKIGSVDWEGLKIPDLFCWANYFLIKLKLVFAIVLGFLGGLLGTSYTNKFMEKKELKKKWWMLLIVFLVLGGAVGYLAFIYFWWILLGLIILGIVRAFIPRVIRR